MRQGRLKRKIEKIESRGGHYPMVAMAPLPQLAVRFRQSPQFGA